MRAAILAGGMGTRLAPYTTVLPKPLVPVGDRPILEVIINQLSAAGFTRVDLCVAHLGELIRAYLTESATVAGQMTIDYHWEDEPLGTAGAIRGLQPSEDTLLVMNGDILSDIDYAELVEAHTDEGAALTIATHTRDVTIQLGVIEGEDRRVTGYVEKPTLHYEVSMGIYVYGQAAVKAIPAGRFDFPDLVLALIEAGEKVARYPFTGAWYDIGTPGDLELANAAYAAEPERFAPA